MSEITLIISFEKEENIEEIWKKLIYFPKQVNNGCIDLTIKKIYAFKSQGSLDFGGSEYLQVDRINIKPMKEDDPKYGWWILDKGTYIIEYNEYLSKDGCLAIVFPHNRLQLTGCYHAPFIVNPAKGETTEPLSCLLIVSAKSVRIKENARISTALTILTDEIKTDN